MIDYIFQWDTPALAKAETDTWPEAPTDANAHKVTVERKMGVDVNGNEIRVPVAGYFLWVGTPDFIPYLANRPSARLIRDRDTRRVKVLNATITKAQLRDLRFSPVSFGSAYDEAAPDFEDGV